MSVVTTVEHEAVLPRYGRRLVFIGSLILACAVLIIVGIMLKEARDDAWEQARQSSENLKMAIIGDVQSQMNRYAQALEFAADALSGHAFRESLDTEQQFVLDQIARNTEIVGSVVVLDKNGTVVAHAGAGVPGNMNVADRAYFSVQRDSADLGTYVSQPFESRLRNGSPSIALSRRISDAKGNFAGVVVIAIRLERFHKVLTQMDIGEGSVLAIITKKGLILSRQPSADGHGDVGRSVADSTTFQTAVANGSTSGVSTSVVDQTQRFYTIGVVPDFPLVVSVALSTQSVLAGWWKLAIVIGPTSLLVCAAIIALAIVLQRKIERLAKTEARLATLATTDGLTGLANRRHFDATVETEWSRARRNGESLSLVLIDADRFKAVNDRFGHLRGDDVLKGIAEAIRSDIAAASQAAIAAGEPGTTVSLGVATMTPDRSNSITHFLMAADQALYEAKARGRNRTVLAERQ